MHAGQIVDNWARSERKSLHGLGWLNSGGDKATWRRHVNCSTKYGSPLNGVHSACTMPMPSMFWHKSSATQATMKRRSRLQLAPTAWHGAMDLPLPTIMGCRKPELIFSHCICPNRSYRLLRLVIVNLCQMWGLTRQKMQKGRNPIYLARMEKPHLTFIW